MARRWTWTATSTVQRSRAAAPDQRFDVQEMFADNDAVVVSWFWHGTHLGEIAGFPPTGKPIRMSGITIYYFDDTIA